MGAPRWDVDGRGKERARYLGECIRAAQSIDVGIATFSSAMGMPPISNSSAKSLLARYKEAPPSWWANAKVRGRPVAAVGEETADRTHVDREAEPAARRPRGPRYKVATISDLHAGSEYVRRAAMRDYVEWAYHDEGVRTILVPGDLLDGYYENHGKFQLSHVGVTAQAKDLIETLPRLDGLRYEAETGNHDATYADSSGLNVVQYINMMFKEAGRDDFCVHGEREVFLRVHGVEFCLWHPRGSFGQAAMRKQMLGFPPGTSPRFLLVGHWHHFDIVTLGRCTAISLPSFQGGGSDFGKSLAGHTTVGGVLLSWELDEDGEPHSIGIQRRDYPERVVSKVVAA